MVANVQGFHPLFHESDSFTLSPSFGPFFERNHSFGVKMLIKMKLFLHRITTDCIFISWAMVFFEVLF